MSTEIARPGMFPNWLSYLLVVVLVGGADLAVIVLLWWLFA